MKDLRNAVKKASKNSSVPSETKKQLKKALDGNWGSGDLVCILPNITVGSAS